MDSKNEVHIEVSRHAERRLRERLGINRRAAKRLAEKAFYEGVRHKDTCGRLKKWMSGLYKKNRKANNMRIYGDFLYRWDENDGKRIKQNKKGLPLVLSAC